MIVRQAGTEFAGRATHQRRLILDIIEQSESHLDAGEIYRKARRKSRSISLSTVYRSLHLFKEQGLVDEHSLDGMRRFYEMRPASRHHHMVCIGCANVFEFTCTSTEEIKSRLTRERGFEVFSVDVRFYGYCSECRRKAADLERR